MQPVKHTLHLLFFCLFILTACEKKPTACLDLPETLEAGTTLILRSCSEDYEFLTWEFSDGLGVEGEIAQRNFEKEGSVTIRLTAYSDGAYRSDQTEGDYFTSFRYIDRFEIIGNSSYDSLEVNFGNLYEFTRSDSKGTFTEADPFVISPSELTNIIEAEPTSINLFGLGFGGSRVPLTSDKFNFDVVKDNPTIIGSEEDRFYVKLYWTYRSF